MDMLVVPKLHGWLSSGGPVAQLTMDVTAVLAYYWHGPRLSGWFARST